MNNFTQGQYDEYLQLKKKELALMEEQRVQKERNKEMLQAGLCGFGICAAIFSIFRL